jgi:N-acetylmuramoyl-L-alanine amidase
LTAVLLGAFVWLVCAAMSAMPVRAAGDPSVLSVRLGEHPDKTRFVLELTEAVEFRVSTLADPYRVVLHLPELSWRTSEVPVSAGLVRGWRHASAGARAMRVVLDLDRPVHVREAFLLPPQDGRQARLVLDLEPTGHAAFMAGIDREGGAHSGAQVPRETALRPGVLPEAEIVAASAAASLRVPATAQVAALASSVAPVPPAPAFVPPPAVLAAVPLPPPLPTDRLRPAAKPMVVIDAGHGGPDPGAIAVSGEHEKTITLAIARELRKLLLATGRYRVTLTRDEDVFIRLRDRVTLARAAGADLFISLHADAIGSRDVRGMSVYTLSDKASDREAASLAARENRADALGGIDLAVESDEVASILIDLARRDTMNHSRRFANLVVTEFSRVATVLPRPHRSAGFAVLTAPDVPSVLIEMGYLSSPKDARLLMQAEHRGRLARAILKGIDGYFAGAAGLSRS